VFATILSHISFQLSADGRINPPSADWIPDFDPKPPRF
jgi:hypothetical protein